MKLTRKNILGVLLVLLVLAAAFFLPELGKSGGEVTPPVGSAPTAEPSRSEAESSAVPGSSPVEPSSGADKEPEEPVVSAPAPSDPVETAPAETESTEPEPTPVQSESVETPEEEMITCTLSINCAAILENMDLLTPGKEILVPADGWLLAETEVEFAAGESVFDVLMRELRGRNMHFEYTISALYGSAYVEGICNLYEYDCGELSGWEFAVNGEFMSCSCSEFILTPGDVVTWVYTCDLGADIGAVISQ